MRRGRASPTGPSRPPWSTPAATCSRGSRCPAVTATRRASQSDRAVVSGGARGSRRTGGDASSASASRCPASATPTPAWCSAPVRCPARGRRTIADRTRAAIGVPVLVDNDARAQALGEKWFGDGRGCRPSPRCRPAPAWASASSSTATLYRGDDGATGELGHTGRTARRRALRAAGCTGCWETIATLRWLRAAARTAGLPGASRLDAATPRRDRRPIRRRALLDDLRRQPRASGSRTSSTCSAPRRLLLHGDVVGGGEPLRARIAERPLRGPCRTSASGRGHAVPLDQDAGLLGAAGLVLSEPFTLAV